MIRALVLMAALLALAADARGRIENDGLRGRRSVSSSLFSLLPGGVPASLVCTNNLQGSLGETVTVVRASTRPCQCIGSSTTLAANVPCIEAGGLSVYGVRAEQAAADVVTVSAAKWPVATGSTCVTYRPEAAAPGTMLDARSTAAVGWALSRDSSDRLSFVRGDGASILLTSAAIPWVIGQSYRACASWGPTFAAVYRDGALLASQADARTVSAIGASAFIGSNLFGTGQINGLIAVECISAAPEGCR